MEASRTERSLGDLFSDLSQQTAELIRHEMRLAKAELDVKASRVGRQAAKLGLGAVFGLAGVMAVTAAIILGLIEAGVPSWVSALITAAVMGLMAYVLAQAGLSELKKQSLAPVETMESVKETAQWIKNETR
jgi:uncharacterized membrane protein YqjE